MVFLLQLFLCVLLLLKDNELGYKINLSAVFPRKCTSAGMGCGANLRKVAAR